MKSSERVRIKAAWLRSLGIAGVWTLVQHRVRGHRSAFVDANARMFQGKGIEIGGPSALFSDRAYAPVYRLAGALDNLNFSSHTRWEGDIETGLSFRFREGAAPGRQFVGEATDLRGIADASYDFLLSSHMLEHSANPLKALAEWQRVLKDDGLLLLVLPHRDGTFDRYRPVTPLQHIVDDFEQDVGEDDETHFEEILRLHDMRRDIWQASRDSLREWVQGNTTNRGVHHHVFDSLAAARMVDRTGFQILAVEPAALESIFVFARKRKPGEPLDNTQFTGNSAPFLRHSPFPTDRLHTA